MKVLKNKSHLILISGKVFVGGQRALENRQFIKHLTSEQFSTGLEGGLNTAISRILGEKKRDVDRNREKRRVTKHQKETKYSLTESILRSKVGGGTQRFTFK